MRSNETWCKLSHTEPSAGTSFHTRVKNTLNSNKSDMGEIRMYSTKRSTFVLIEPRGNEECTRRMRPQPFVRITLYSQDELERYHLDQSDLQHPWDFDTRPTGSQIVKNKSLHEESSKIEIGNHRAITV